MKNLFRLLGLLVLICAVILPLNTSFAAKWNRGNIVVYIPKDDTYDPMMKNAVSEWQGKIRKIFLTQSQYEKDLKVSDIDVVFNKLKSEDAENSCSAGVVSSSSNSFRHVKIVLNINESAEILNDTEKKQANSDEIYALMLKSVGLALGVPESTDENSVMFKEYKEGQKILPSDVENMYKVYGWRIPNSNTK